MAACLKRNMEQRTGRQLRRFQVKFLFPILQLARGQRTTNRFAAGRSGGCYSSTDSDFNPHPATLIALAGVFFYFSSARGHFLVGASWVTDN